MLSLFSTHCLISRVRVNVSSSRSWAHTCSRASRLPFECPTAPKSKGSLQVPSMPFQGSPQVRR